ncbi:hypothetical protein [Halobacillus hunanensis]|uniref:hypothetical protein n=1 Tax=Halobacillus hunanensis TaxID=578214 RepID=UPI00158FA60E|nr:hypothetical protein [Halobacillus hunanensis]
MAKRLVVTGFGCFFTGISLLLLDFLTKFVPILTLGGISLVVIAVFLQKGEKNSRS